MAKKKNFKGKKHKWPATPQKNTVKSFEGENELGVFVLSDSSLRIGDRNADADSCLEFPELVPGDWLVTQVFHDSGALSGEVESIVMQNIDTVDDEIDWRWVEQPALCTSGTILCLSGNAWQPIDLDFDWALFDRGILHRLPDGVTQVNVSVGLRDSDVVAIELLINEAEN